MSHRHALLTISTFWDVAGVITKQKALCNQDNLCDEVPTP